MKTKITPALPDTTICTQIFLKLVAVIFLMFFGFIQSQGQTSSTIYLDNNRETLPSAENAIYILSCEMGGTGLYNVKIKTLSSGVLVMTGTYSDASLTTEEGYFYYYFANGMPESEGLYKNGIKTGVWKRWDATGSNKPNRIYPQSECVPNLTALNNFN